MNTKTEGFQNKLIHFVGIFLIISIFISLCLIVFLVLYFKNTEKILEYSHSENINWLIKIVLFLNPELANSEYYIYGKPYVLVASSFGNEKLVKTYLETNFINNDNLNKCLNDAIMQENIELCDLILEKGANINADRFHVIEATRWRSEKILEYLLSKGANPDVSLGLAITESALEEKSEKVKILLKYGANPNLRNPYLWSKATEKQQQKALELIASVQASLAAE
jgi:ankyrin repeat protein